MKPMRVLSVFGTRPEAIKMAPLVKALENEAAIESKVCVTAQHRQILDQVLKQFDIHPDFDLDLMKSNQTLTSITTGVLEGMEQVLTAWRPDLVLVHGDTTTSMAAAMAAFYQQVAVGHVEAGLRSFDSYSPYPEEMNRQITGRIASLHFAPTEQSEENLAKENIHDNVFVVGNTVIDALKMMVHENYQFKSEELQRLNLNKGRIIVLTAHRRENLGKPLQHICNAAKQIVIAFPDVQIIYPMHPNPQVRNTAKEALQGLPQVHLIEPIEVEDMHNLLNKAYLVMSDSGGLQEEAPALGKPVIVLRTETERPEVIAAGKAILAGTKEKDIVQAATELLTNKVLYQQMAQATHPYGNGDASKKIVKALLEL